MHIYIHIPFCISRCSYCDFHTKAIGNDKSELDEYTRKLVLQIENAPISDAEVSDVRTIYFGGGTPSILEYKHLKAISQAIRNRFYITNNAEITIEMNPATLFPAKIEAFLESGINRVSIGLQSGNDKDLKILNRAHNLSDYHHSVDNLLKAGITNISTDIIYGLPFQTESTLLDTLRMIPNEVNHISTYALEVYDHTPIAKFKKSLPSDEETISMYELIEENLLKRGILKYEISNFAREGFESRHNIAYWERADYIGFGASAHSLLGSRRFENKDFEMKLIEDLTEDEAFSEAIILGLRMTKGIDADKLFKRYRQNLFTKYSGQIDKLLSRNLIKRQNNTISLTQLGFALANQVFLEFI